MILLLWPFFHTSAFFHDWVLSISSALLTGLEVWYHGWRPLLLVRVQATVTSPLERFIYQFFYQIVGNCSVRLNGAGVMMWECTHDISGWMPYPIRMLCFPRGPFSYVSTLFFRDIYWCFDECQLDLTTKLLGISGCGSRIGSSDGVLESQRPHPKYVRRKAGAVTV